MKIITICGSMKYQKEMMKIAEEYTKKGNCILTPIYPTKNISEYSKDDIKTMKVMHLERIKLSDAILVLNMDGYIGDSTKKEIEFAKSLKKEIIYYN